MKRSLCILLRIELSISVNFVVFRPIVSKVWSFLDLKIKLKNLLFGKPITFTWHVQRLQNKALVHKTFYLYQKCNLSNYNVKGIEFQSFDKLKD